VTEGLEVYGQLVLQKMWEDWCTKESCEVLSDTRKRV